MSEERRLLPRARHACRACGKACHGVDVHLLPKEAERVRAHAIQLGVTEPIRDDVLVRVDGICCLLGDDGLCRLHAAFGPEAKPFVCGQYPLMVVQGLVGYRVAVDPGCFHALETWRDGPVLAPPGDVAVLPGAEDPAEAMAEREVAERLDGAPTLRSALGRLVSEPDRVASRLVRALRRASQDEVLEATPGPASGEVVLRQLARARRWNQTPPWPALDPILVAYAVHAARVQVLLRFGTRGTTPEDTAALMLCGALISAWADPRPERFAAGLAAWSRCLRVPEFAPAILGGAAGVSAVLGRDRGEPPQP